MDRVTARRADTSETEVNGDQPIPQRGRRRGPPRSDRRPAIVARSIVGTPRGGQRIRPSKVAQLRRATDDDTTAPSGKERTAGLPASLRAGIEGLSGVDMTDVTVHHDSPQPAEFGAAAFARGTEIHLGPGQEAHLPHEAWHVVQQAQGRVRPTRQATDTGAVNDETALEREATEMGSRATSGSGLVPDSSPSRDRPDATSDVAQLGNTPSRGTKSKGGDGDGDEIGFTDADEADGVLRSVLSGAVGGFEWQRVDGDGDSGDLDADAPAPVPMFVVCAGGSYARRELTKASDLDLIIVVEHSHDAPQVHAFVSGCLGELRGRTDRDVEIEKCETGRRIVEQCYTGMQKQQPLALSLRPVWSSDDGADLLSVGVEDERSGNPDYVSAIRRNAQESLVGASGIMGSNKQVDLKSQVYRPLQILTTWLRVTHDEVAAEDMLGIIRHRTVAATLGKLHGQLLEAVIAVQRMRVEGTELVASKQFAGLLATLSKWLAAQPG